ncbi:MAG: hypothetical protein JWL78_210, partial [Chloroflexi bacterium]|nr:hypothetical protein [Chloroflexota bacterium]
MTPPRAAVLGAGALRAVAAASAGHT